MNEAANMSTINHFWLHCNKNWIRERSDLATLEPVDLDKIPCLVLILAEDMGLGKTLITLALILETSNQAQDSGNSLSPFNTLRCGATLVICPKATLKNWNHKITTHFAKNSIPYLIFYGRGCDFISKETLKSSMVVPTSYDLIGTSGSPLQTNQNIIKSLNMEWSQIVLNEAQ
jgi:DNA repair protein RAD5